MELDRVARGLRAIVQGNPEYVVKWDPIALSFRRRYRNASSLVLLMPEKDKIRFDYRGPTEETWEIFTAQQPNAVIVRMFERYTDALQADKKNFHYTALCSHDEGVEAFQYVANGLVSHLIN